MFGSLRYNNYRNRPKLKWARPVRMHEKKAGKLQTGSTIPKQYWLAVNGKPKMGKVPSKNRRKSGLSINRLYTRISIIKCGKGEGCFVCTVHYARLGKRKNFNHVGQLRRKSSPVFGEMCLQWYKEIQHKGISWPKVNAILMWCALDVSIKLQFTKVKAVYVCKQYIIYFSSVKFCLLVSMLTL